MYCLIETPHKDDGFFLNIRWKQGENKTKQKYYTNFSPSHPLPLYGSQFPFIYISSVFIQFTYTHPYTLYLHKPIQYSQHIHHCGPPKTKPQKKRTNCNLTCLSYGEMKANRRRNKDNHLRRNPGVSAPGLSLWIFRVRLTSSNLEMPFTCQSEGINLSKSAPALSLHTPCYSCQLWEESWRHQERPRVLQFTVVFSPIEN